MRMQFHKKIYIPPEIKNPGEIRKCPKLKPPKISTITVIAIAIYIYIISPHNILGFHLGSLLKGKMHPHLNLLA